jgi:fibronectin type 3 domain-containing protein
MRIIGLGVIFLILTIGCSNEVDNPEGLPPLPQQPGTPRDLSAEVGDAQVILNWSINRPETVDYYKLYLSDSASVEGMRFLDSTDQLNYAVSNLVNGKRYYFRISIVDNSGLEGEMSDALSAVPGVFSIAIENQKEYINSRNVTINLIAPALAELVELSESSDFSQNFRLLEFNSIIQYELSDGDGVKTVYARFELLGGGASIGFVSDTIILDRLAVIDSVTVATGGGQVEPGDVVHFALYVAETGGEAAVKIGDGITFKLNDRGIAGDAVANDGIYEADYVIPMSTDLTSAVITGTFTDAAGNLAPQVTAATTLTVVDLPEPVQLFGYAKSSSEITLQWSKSNAIDFAAYRLFRSTGGSVNQNSNLVTAITQATTTTYSDTDLDALTTYYYRVYVYDSDGNFAGSDSLDITTLTNQPPDPVTIAARLTGDALTVELSWEKSEDTDFKAYHLLRNNSSLPASYDPTKVIKVISSSATTTFIDKVPVNGTYYYQVYVFDQQGEKTESNEVSIAVP